MSDKHKSDVTPDPERDADPEGVEGDGGDGRDVAGTGQDPATDRAAVVQAADPVSVGAAAPEPEDDGA